MPNPKWTLPTASLYWPHRFNTFPSNHSATTIKDTTMTTATNKTTPIAAPAPAAPLSLAIIIDAIFAPALREKIDAATAGDKSDAAYTWGM